MHTSQSPKMLRNYLGISTLDWKYDIEEITVLCTELVLGNRFVIIWFKIFFFNGCKFGLHAVFSRHSTFMQFLEFREKLFLDLSCGIITPSLKTSLCLRSESLFSTTFLYILLFQSIRRFSKNYTT